MLSLVQDDNVCLHHSIISCSRLVHDSQLVGFVLLVGQIYGFVEVAKVHSGPNYYQYKILPFGFSTTPRILTQYLAVVAAHLRRQGINRYLDNWQKHVPT